MFVVYEYEGSPVVAMFSSKEEATNFINQLALQGEDINDYYVVEEQ